VKKIRIKYYFICTGIPEDDNDFVTEKFVPEPSDIFLCIKKKVVTVAHPKMEPQELANT